MHCSDVLFQTCLRLYLVITMLTLISDSLMLGFLVLNKVMVLGHRVVTLIAFVSQSLVLVFLMNCDIALGCCLKWALVT